MIKVGTLPFTSQQMQSPSGIAFIGCQGFRVVSGFRVVGFQGYRV